MARQSFSKLDSGTSQSTVIGNFGLSCKKARHNHQDVATITALFRTQLHQFDDGADSSRIFLLNFNYGRHETEQ